MSDPAPLSKRRVPLPAALGLLALLVLGSRAPFIGAGYGWHADNWRIALAARHIAERGVYEASRFPGYPLQEYLCALVWRGGALAFNTLDALFCTAAAVLFALICRAYRLRDWWLAGLTLAFVPVLYVNSVSSKDFPWALALLLGAWWCAMRKKAGLTGLLLGLAMGCRITSGAAALPITLLLSEGAPNAVALRRIARAGLVAAVVAAGAFTPVYLRYGTDFFNFYAEHAFPTPAMIAARMTLEVWGQLGVVGLLVAYLPAALKPKRGATREIPPRHLLAWVCMLVIYACAFLCLPDEAAYLIPAVPFMLLLAACAAPAVCFRICCGLVMLSPFFSWNPPGAPLGLVLQDHRDRVETMGQVRGFLQFASQVSGSNAYIVGSWQPPIDVMTADHPDPARKYVYLVTKGELAALRAKGYRVWYLPMMREFNYRVYRYDVAEEGARDVHDLRPAEAARP